MNYHFKFLSFDDLPYDWDDIVASENRLLSKEYFIALLHSLPYNMSLNFIAYYGDEQLIGGALLQHLFFSRHDSFNPQHSSFCSLRNFVTRLFANEVTILGNNMLSGQNGFYFDLNYIGKEESLSLLMQSVRQINPKFKKNKLTVLKDFNQAIMELFPKKSIENYMPFEVQPTMILEVQHRWKNFEEYYSSMKKKYRARVRTARKKIEPLQRKELDLQSLENAQEIMHQLYMVVAKNADFNTFFLPENHFYQMKKHLKENFKVVAYYKDHQMIGFYTLINNYRELDTYFLGYDKELQKPYQIYLNMLLDMVDDGISHQVQRINFGRTAIEIKMTIGATPKKLYGLIHHRYTWLNRMLPGVFRRFNISYNYIERSPF